MRIVGGDGNKVYNVERSGKKVCVYEKETGVVFMGKTGRLIFMQVTSWPMDQSFQGHHVGLSGNFPAVRMM